MNADTENPKDKNPTQFENTDNEAPAEELGKETASLTQEVSDLKDKYMRAVAEMENMRRRMERERGELIKYGLENVFKDFLPVLDSLDKALPDDAAKSNGSGSQSYFDGMVMVKRQLMETFRRHGLEPIASQGVAFDPNLHQAIQKVESSDVASDTVGQEFARGYMLNGRLIRPAMVSVLTPHGS